MGFEYTPQPNTGAAAGRVKGPAITPIVITALGILGQLVSMAANLAGLRSMPVDLPPDMERWVSMMSGGLGVVATVLTLAVGGLIIFGAMKMMNLQRKYPPMAETTAARLREYFAQNNRQLESLLGWPMGW